VRRQLEKDTVADVGYRALVSVAIGASVSEAVAEMQAQSVGCIVILDGRRPAGIITERDVVTRGICEGRGLTGRVEDFMTPEPRVAQEDEAIHLVLARMHRGGFRHLPVVDRRGRALGTISIKRAVHFLGEVMPRTVYNLPPQPGSFPSSREGG